MNVDLTHLITHVQKQFYPLFRPISERYRFFTSGRGGGKSVAITQRLIDKSFDCGGNILVVQSTLTACRDASYAELLGRIEELGLQDCFITTKSPLEITNIKSGVKFLFRGADSKPDKLKSMKGICIVWFEEMDLVPEFAFDIIDLSARGVKYDIEIYGSFNPGDPFIWCKKYLDEPEKYDCFHHKSYYFENPFIGEHFIIKMNMLKKTDPDRYKRDGLGEFTQKDGLVIHQKNFVDWTPEDDEFYGSYDYDFNGLDFNNGGSHPQAFVSGTYYADTNILVMEYVKTLIGGDFGEFIKTVDKKYKRIQNGYADSACPDKIRKANKNGFLFTGANKQKVKVDSYIEFINSCKKVIIKPAATEFKRECGKWEYIKGTKNKSSGTPKKIDDDINDAIRYGLNPILLEIIEGEIETSNSLYE